MSLRPFSTGDALSADRDGVIQRAERLVKQGRLEPAITEYERLVAETPRDWAAANALGDLYLRTGRPDRAVDTFSKIAERFVAEHVLAKASALYKKILKIQPEHEAALLQLADLSVKQKLVGDARAYLATVVRLREQRADQQGANVIRARLRALEAPTPVGAPDASPARLPAAPAQTSAVPAEPPRDRTRPVVRAAERATAGHRADSSGASELAEAERSFLDGRPDDGVTRVRRLLADATVGDHAVVDLALRMAARDLDAAFVLIDLVADARARAGRFGDATACLERFLERSGPHVLASLRLVEVCRDGGLEAEMRVAQGRLADACLAAGRASEARQLAEDLLTHEPSDAVHLDRLRRATAILRGGSAPAAGRPAAPARGPAAAAIPRGAEAGDAAPGFSPGSPGLKTRPADAVSRTGGVPPAAPPPADEASILPVATLVDLSDSLARLGSDRPRPKLFEMEEPAEEPAADEGLPQIFQGFREAVRRERSEEHAARFFKLAVAYDESGMTAEAIEAFEAAARSARYRFDAAAMLGHLYQRLGMPGEAVEWFERAAEAPPPSVERGRDLLYDLGQSLERVGERARALAVYLELQADVPGYRDIGLRIDRLSRAPSES
jgi:tetratricopeptide (TPR) repeat protein